MPWKHHYQPEWQSPLVSPRVPGRLEKERSNRPVNPRYEKSKNNKGKKKHRNESKFREHYITIGIEQIVRDAVIGYNWLIKKDKINNTKFIVLHDNENKNICEEEITWGYLDMYTGFTYVGNNEQAWKLLGKPMIGTPKNIINELENPLNQ